MSMALLPRLSGNSVLICDRGQQAAARGRLQNGSSLTSTLACLRSSLIKNLPVPAPRRHVIDGPEQHALCKDASEFSTMNVLGGHCATQTRTKISRAKPAALMLPHRWPRHDAEGRDCAPISHINLCKYLSYFNLAPLRRWVTSTETSTTASSSIVYIFLENRLERAPHLLETEGHRRVLCSFLFVEVSSNCYSLGDGHTKLALS